MEEKITAIKEWLGTGSINVFGLPMSGKDTVGVKLAELLGAKFLSSGMIIRTMEEEEKNHMSDSGELIPQDVFYKWILPYFKRSDLNGFPLVLSSVGRWSGEEVRVMEAAEDGGHPIKVAILLSVSEADVLRRWETVHELGKRDLTHTLHIRADDAKEETFKTRIREFNEKTVPVLQTYQSKGMLLPVKASLDRESVFNLVVDELYKYAVSHEQ
ncbi:nucleoside monophosphate kinase [Candidatus Saccharibacteria bacterium]|nr:nucleoside monophosphate kinase [Candidatus Saccharibacteria bacterium]